MTHFLVSIAIRDERGALAHVARHLASWHINLKGFVVDAAGMRILVNDALPVAKCLDQIGILYRIEAVQQVKLEDRPGSLAELCWRLAEAHIDIHHAFGVASGGLGHFYISVDDAIRAAPIFEMYAGETPVVRPSMERLA